MSVVVVDASVWISVFVRQDAHHAISREWRLQWTNDGGSFVLPQLILPEVSGAVTRRIGRAVLGLRAAATLRDHPSISLVSLDEGLAEVTLEHAASFPLKGSDAVYTALADQLGIPLITWDNEQLTRAGGRIQVRQPTL
jgi:predicted nucleic acid-binding protein